MCVCLSYVFLLCVRLCISICVRMSLQCTFLSCESVGLSVYVCGLCMCCMYVYLCMCPSHACANDYMSICVCV